MSSKLNNIVFLLSVVLLPSVYSLPEDSFQLVERLKVLFLELGLFGYDLVSDIMNGVNFIKHGHILWGSIVLAVLFTPMAVWNPFDEGGLGIIQHAGPLKKLLLYTFFYIPAVIVSTPCYVIYVIYVGIRKLINPLYEDAWNGQKAAMIKGYEAMYEANPQVLFVLLTVGLSEEPVVCFFQVSGVVISYISVAKIVAEKHLFTDLNASLPREYQIPVSLLLTVKSLSFFLPHVLFRSVSITLLAAFFRMYALIPIFIYMGIMGIFTRKTPDLFGTFYVFIVSLTTPTVPNSQLGPHRRILKLSLLCAPLVLFPSLILLRLLPLLAPAEDILATPGLSHLYFSSSGTDYHFCSNIANLTGHSCTMALSHENFSTYVLPPVLILGIWCVLESILIQIKSQDGKTTRFWTPYRLAHQAWLKDTDAYLEKAYGSDEETKDEDAGEESNRGLPMETMVV